jgi:hypothetical protein
LSPLDAPTFPPVDATAYCKPDTLVIEIFDIGVRAAFPGGESALRLGCPAQAQPTDIYLTALAIVLTVV